MTVPFARAEWPDSRSLQHPRLLRSELLNRISSTASHPPKAAQWMIRLVADLTVDLIEAAYHDAVVFTRDDRQQLAQALRDQLRDWAPSAPALKVSFVFSQTPLNSSRWSLLHWLHAYGSRHSELAAGIRNQEVGRGVYLQDYLNALAEAVVLSFEEAVIASERDQPEALAKALSDVVFLNMHAALAAAKTQGSDWTLTLASSLVLIAVQVGIEGTSELLPAVVDPAYRSATLALSAAHIYNLTYLLGRRNAKTVPDLIGHQVLSQSLLLPMIKIEAADLLAQFEGRIRELAQRSPHLRSDALTAQYLIEDRTQESGVLPAVVQMSKRLSTNPLACVKLFFSPTKGK